MDFNLFCHVFKIYNVHAFINLCMANKSSRNAEFSYHGTAVEISQYLLLFFYHGNSNFYTWHTFYNAIYIFVFTIHHSPFIMLCLSIKMNHALSGL